MSGVVRARWTDQILDEAFHNIVANRPDLSLERLSTTRRKMCEAVEDCLVSGYAGLADGIALPDPGDRHVVAAAVRCSAQTIVTLNLKDFPPSALAALSIEAQHPDTFLSDLFDLAPAAIVAAVTAQAAALRHPPQSVGQLLATLERNGLVRTVEELRTALRLE